MIKRDTSKTFQYLYRMKQNFITLRLHTYMNKYINKKKNFKNEANNYVRSLHTHITFSIFIKTLNLISIYYKTPQCPITIKRLYT